MESVANSNVYVDIDYRKGSPVEDAVLFEKFSRYSNLCEVAGKPEYVKGEVFAIEPYQYRVISRFYDQKTSTEGHIFQRLDRDNKYVLAFKGSVELKDWFSDLRFWKKQWPFVEGKDHKIALHTGFIDNYRTVRLKILRELAEIKAACPQKPVVTICGHSLGGALTLIATLDLKLFFNDSFDLSTYTFGAPRVFNRSGYNLFSSIVSYAYRITHEKDPVPTMPVRGFQHVGKLYHLYGNGTYDSNEYHLFPLFSNPKDHFVRKYMELIRLIIQRFEQVQENFASRNLD